MGGPYIEIGSRRVSAATPTYVIAEIGVNHNGDEDLALRLVDEAKAAGADAVKFQTFKTDALVSATAAKAAYQEQSTGAGSQSEMLRSLELPFASFARLKQHCDEVGIDFISTAFDSESLDFVVSLSPLCLKWPSGELNNRPLLNQARRSKLPILLSTGMGSLAEVEAALGWLGEDTQVAILQCVSNYPARIEDQNLRTISTMAKAFNRPTGFSDHTIGPYAALAARALGMSVLEKHFTLDRTMPGPDHSSSVEPAEFAEMVALLRKIEIGLGDGVKRAVASETGVRAVVRKSIVYQRNLQAGDRIEASDVAVKRPAGGISPQKLDAVVGRVLVHDVHADHQASFDDFK